MTISSNLNFELLGVLVSLLSPALMTRTLRVSIWSHPKMSIGSCVDFSNCDISRARLTLHRQTCVYIPNSMYYIKQGFVCSRLSEPQWPLKFGRHSHFKGLLVLVIYNFVAVVELLAAMLRVRTQERVCGPKGNMLVRIKCLLTSAKQGLRGKMNHGYIFILCGFLLPVRYRKQNNHEQVPNISPWLATLSKDICTAAKLGERRLFKVALPETASNQYFSFWSSGRPLDSGQARRQFNFPPCRCCMIILFFFCKPQGC